MVKSTKYKTLNGSTRPTRSVISANAWLRDAFLVVIAVIAGTVIGVKSCMAQAQIWLAPMSTLSPHGYGATDFMKLVSEPESWRVSAPFIHVFKLYPYFVGRASDVDLKAIFQVMRSNNIRLALEARVLEKTRGCGRVAGDGGQTTIHLLQRVQRLGATLSYLAMDEPLKHAMAGDPGCRAPLRVAVEDVAARVREFRSVFPDLQVGDIEPIGSWPTTPNLLADISAWIAAYRAATGEPLAFFHADVGWNTDWLPICSDLQTVLRRQNIRFGMIYNGEDLAHSSSEWTDQAVAHFRRFEISPRSAPNDAIFQSWVRFPERVLPEHGADSLMSVVLKYSAFRK